MTKKIFALVMVVSVLGVFVAGCSKGDDASKDAAPAATAGTAGTAGAPAAPAAGDATK